MIISIIFSLNLICSTIFSFMKHPLAMGFMLLMQTLLICLTTGSLTKSFWFSYVLFLIFLGGMLVLFMYVTSLASNEMFNFSIKTLMFSSIIFFTMIIFLLMNDSMLTIKYLMNNEVSTMVNMKNFLLENTFLLNKLYNFPINMITIMLMIYLFLTLIAVVKITNIFEGPLRPTMN